MFKVGAMVGVSLPGSPVGLGLFRYRQWLPLLPGLLPGGAGRRAWLKRLQGERKPHHQYP